MITIKHNILHNKFRKILVSPKNDNVPYNFFRRLKDDKDEDFITRTIDLSRFDESKQISIIVSKVTVTDKKEFIRYYKFTVSEKNGIIGTYKDDNITISTKDGDVVCDEVSDLINLEDAQNLIAEKGREDCERIYANLHSISANYLYKIILSEFYKKEYEAMSIDHKYSILINSCYKLEIINIYTNGIRQFIKENNFGMIDNEQRLLDEVQIQLELYKITNAEKYLNNCKLFLKQCPDERILEDAFVLWDKEEEFDFLWDTRHLDCRFSVGLEDSTWHMWVGINHHSSDDETYTNGVGGEDIDEDCNFAYTFFEEMQWHIIECGRK